VVLQANTILPIYSRCLKIRAAAAVDLTWYLFHHPSLADAVFQHPTLLLGIVQQLGAVANRQPDHRIAYSDLTDILAIIIGSRPTQVAAHAPFIAALQQLLAAGHAGAAYLLRVLSTDATTRQLITSQPQLAVALAGALQGPGSSWPHNLHWLDALVGLATSPDSSSVVLASSTFCQGLVKGMAAALASTSDMKTDTAVMVWTWLQQLVAHEPSRRLLLSWRPQQQAPGGQAGLQGKEQGAAPPPPPAAAAAAGGAGGSSRFLTALLAALQCIPPKAMRWAGTVFSTLLEATPDQQQLLEELEVPSWLNSIRVNGMSEEAQAPWAQAVALLLSQPAGRAALWAAPQLLAGVLQVASSGQIWAGTIQHPVDSRWQQLRARVREDAGYQAALLEGLRAGHDEWLWALRTEVSAIRHCIAASCGPSGCSPAYSVLQLPGLPEALTAACTQEVPEGMWVVLLELLSYPPGHAFLKTHPLLVTAVASLLARANCQYFGPILRDMCMGRDSDGTGVCTFVLSQPKLLKGLVMGAVGVGAAMHKRHINRLAATPWFSQAVEADGEVLDFLLRALGPVAQTRRQQQQQQQQNHQQGLGQGQYSPSCQEVVLANLDKEALFPKLLQRLSNTEDVKLVQGAWNGLDWLRRSGAPWDEAVPRALGNRVKAAGRAGELPQLQLAVTQTAVQLAQEHAALREQQQLLEAARAALAAIAGGNTASAEAVVALPPSQQHQQQDLGAEGQQVQEGGGKRARKR
jgi:hypothetical protein